MYELWLAGRRRSKTRPCLITILRWADSRSGATRIGSERSTRLSSQRASRRCRPSENGKDKCRRTSYGDDKMRTRLLTEKQSPLIDICVAVGNVTLVGIGRALAITRPWD